MLPSSSITIVNIYRSPAGSIASFIEELADLIASIVANTNDKLLFLGDFNCPETDDLHVDDGLKLLLKSFGLDLLVHEPTRGGSRLDVIASDDRGLFSDLCTADARLISDHRLIHCKIRVRRPVIRPVEVSIPKVKNIDLPTFEQALRRSSLFKNAAATADSFADQLADVISVELDLVAPLTTYLRRQSKPSTKWLSNEAADAKRERRRLEGV